MERDPERFFSIFSFRKLWIMQRERNQSFPLIVSPNATFKYRFVFFVSGCDICIVELQSQTEIQKEEKHFFFSWKKMQIMILLLLCTHSVKVQRVFFSFESQGTKEEDGTNSMFLWGTDNFKGNENPLHGFSFLFEKKVKKLLWSPPKVYFEKCQSSFCLFFSLSLSFFLSLIGFVGSIPLSVSLVAGMQRVQEQQQQLMLL